MHSIIHQSTLEFYLHILFSMARYCSYYCSKSSWRRKTPLIIALIMNISGVFFMIVLANGYLGFKNYGYLGAALGNGISYLVGGVCIIIAWVSGLLSVRPKII